jgi:outer membrane protein
LLHRIPVRRVSYRCLGLALAAGALALGTRARAETLFDAIQVAYQTNPKLLGDQADLRAIDEGYVQARSEFGPQASATGQYEYQNAHIEQPATLFSPAQTAHYHAAHGAGAVSVTQPIFTSGATQAKVRTAEANILAGRETLRYAESQLVLAVVQAYVDVRRDRQVLEVIHDEIAALTREFAEIKARGALGTLTKTDVALAEGRLLSAQAQLRLAQGQLDVSHASYLAVVGHMPGDLEKEPALEGLPETVDEAFDAAEHNNPQLRSAQNSEIAAREQIKQARALSGPTVSVKLDGSYGPYQPYLPGQYERNLSAAVVLDMPLFTSGYNGSKVREATNRDTQSRMEIDATRREVIQNAAQAWTQLISARNAIAIQQHQVDAIQDAVIGTRIEAKVGTRPVIDLLNTELELANARVTLLQSRRDEYMAQASLLSAIGVLELRNLTPGAQLYDAGYNFRRVRNRTGLPGASAIETIVQGIETIVTGKGADPNKPASGETPRYPVIQAQPDEGAAEGPDHRPDRAPSSPVGDPSLPARPVAVSRVAP